MTVAWPPRAEQQLILRVAAAFFDVLRSQENLAPIAAEEAASQEVMNRSQERYDLDFAEISAAYDSQATELSRTATQHQAKAVNAGMLPTLTLNVNSNDIPETDNPFGFISQASNSTAIGVTLNIPLPSRAAQIWRV